MFRFHRLPPLPGGGRQGKAGKHSKAHTDDQGYGGVENAVKIKGICILQVYIHVTFVYDFPKNRRKGNNNRRKLKL